MSRAAEQPAVSYPAGISPNQPPPPQAPPLQPGNVGDPGRPLAAGVEWNDARFPTWAWWKQNPLILMMAVLVLIVAAAYLFLPDDKPYPDNWDPRVLDLVDFVEQDRGLTFDHPVYIRFVEPQVIDDELGDATLDSYTEADSSLAQAGAYYRAVGLAEGEFNIQQASSDLESAGVEAFYSPADNTIVVPINEPLVDGEPLPVPLRITLVHELVHGLQDQHFPNFGLTFQQNPDVALGLLEGDASLVELHYWQQLSEVDQQEYIDQYEATADEYEEGTANVPAILQAEFADSYVLGEVFVTVLWEDGGFARVNKSFVAPPEGTDAFIDPHEFLTGDAVDPPEIPERPDDTDQLFAGSAGPVHWFLAFSEFAPPAEALASARLIGGDGYVAYETSDNVVCVDFNVVADAPDNLDALVSALDAWVARDTTNRSASLIGDTVDVQGCDPGVDADLDLPADMIPLFVAARYVIEAETWALGEGYGIAVGQCMSSLGLEGFTPDQDGISGWFSFVPPAADSSAFAVCADQDK